MLLRLKLFSVHWLESRLSLLELSWRVALCHTPVLEGKPNANNVHARIRNSVHSDYILGHHHTLLKINIGKVLYYIKMSKTSTKSLT
jgi:hypothetical protein